MTTDPLDALAERVAHNLIYDAGLDEYERIIRSALGQAAAAAQTAEPEPPLRFAFWDKERARRWKGGVHLE